MEYIGTYRVNKKLTEALNMPGWFIYRNPSVGLFAVHDSLEYDIDLVWYTAKSISNLEKFAEQARRKIENYINKYPASTAQRYYKNEKHCI